MGGLVEVKLTTQKSIPSGIQHHRQPLPPYNSFGPSWHFSELRFIAFIYGPSLPVESVVKTRVKVSSWRGGLNGKRVILRWTSKAEKSNNKTLFFFSQASILVSRCRSSGYYQGAMANHTSQIYLVDGVKCVLHT